MGLKDDLEKACQENLGTDAVTSGNCPKVAAAQTDAIVNWITKQTFRIVEMKAILEVEKMTTTAPYTADVQPTVMVSPGIPTAGSPAAHWRRGSGIAPRRIGAGLLA